MLCPASWSNSVVLTSLPAACPTLSPSSDDFLRLLQAEKEGLVSLVNLLDA